MAEMAAQSDASSIGEAVCRVAEAEGAVSLWARLAVVAKNFEERSEHFTKGHAAQRVVDILAQGADDTWSGRGNDIARARFDGMRKAAQDVEYIF